MRKESRLLKIIAVIVSAIFLYQQIAWAESNFEGSNHKNFYKDFYQESNTVRTDTHTDIHVPRDLARIEERYLTENEELIINIQDCHSSLSAQYSIVGILKDLLKNYDLNIVAIEGGTGYIDTSLLGSFPDENVKEKTASYLMKQGKVSAGEFFSIMTGDKVALYGVEDNQLYRENLKAFRKIYAENRHKIKFLDSLLKRLKESEERVYSPELRKAVFKSRLHRHGKINFDIYWDFLEKVCRNNDIPTDGQVSIKSFLRSMEMEKKIDFDNATSERKSLIDEIMSLSDKQELGRLVLRSLSFEKGKLTEAGYYRWLLELARGKDIDTGKYSDLTAYTEYVDFCQELDIRGLQYEIEHIEKAVLEKLFSSPEERQLFDLVRFTEMLMSLFEIKLSSEETAYFSKSIDNIKADDYLDFLGGDDENRDDIDDLSRSISEAILEAKKSLKFYEVAEKRNNAMLANTVKAMRMEGKRAAALISGGHHSRGLTELMKEKGLSYLIFMPKFSNHVSRPYVAVLTKKTGPYKELAESGKYYLALQAYFDTGDLSEMEEVLAYSIGQSLLSGKDIRSEIDEWVDSYREAYAGLDEKRLSAMAAGPVKPEELKECLERLKVIEAGEGFCEIQLKGNTYRITGEEMEIIPAGREGITRRVALGDILTAFRRIKSFFELGTKVGYEGALSLQRFLRLLSPEKELNLMEMSPEDILEGVSPDTKNHSLRDARIACGIARELGLPDEDIKLLEYMGYSHDIGNAEKFKYPEALKRINDGFHALSDEDRTEPVVRYLDMWLDKTAPKYAPAEKIEEVRKAVHEPDYYYLIWELYITYAVLRKDFLTEEEKAVAFNVYSHGAESVRKLDERSITYPEELGLLISCHHDYNLLNSILKAKVERGEISPEEAARLKLLESIFIVSDAFEQGNNYERLVEMKGKERVETFAETMSGWMKKRFDDMEMIDERRPLEALKQLIWGQDEELFDIVADARKTKELMPGDMEFIKSAPHVFKAVSGLRAGSVAVIISISGILTSAIQLMIQHNITLITVAASLGAIYFGLAAIKYLWAARATYEALEKYYVQNPDRENYPDTFGIPTLRQLRKIEIARNDGYRHPAFAKLTPRAQTFIVIHELFKFHVMGMLGMLPAFSQIRARKAKIRNRYTRILGDLSEKEYRMKRAFVDGVIQGIERIYEQRIPSEYAVGENRTTSARWGWVSEEDAIKASAIIKNYREVKIAVSLLLDRIEITSVSYPWKNPGPSFEAGYGEDTDYTFDASEVERLIKNPGELRGLIDDELAKQDRGREFPEPVPHAFRAVSGLRAGFTAAGIGILSLAGGVIGFILQGDFSLLSLIAVFAGMYFTWAGIRYLWLGRGVYRALEDYYRENPDLESFPDTGGIPSPGQIRRMKIADRDGYRHPAFNTMSRYERILVLLHESCKSHITGMMALLPGLEAISLAVFLDKIDIDVKKIETRMKIGAAIVAMAITIFTGITLYVFRHDLRSATNPDWMRVVKGVEYYPKQRKSYMDLYKEGQRIAGLRGALQAGDEQRIRAMSLEMREEAIPLLVEALKDEYSFTREAAADALREMGWKPVTQEDKINFYILQHEWDEVFKIGEPAIPRLVGLMVGKDWKLCGSVALAISETDNYEVPGAGEIIDTLLWHFRTGDMYVKWQAFVSLLPLREHPAVEPAINPLLEDKVLRYICELGASPWGNPIENDDIKGLVESGRILIPGGCAAYLGDGNCKWGAYELGEIKDPRAIEPLKKARRFWSGDSAVREMCDEALKKFGITMPPYHPFAGVSKYSLFGLGGGIDWVVLFKGAVAGIGYALITKWHDFPLWGNIALIVLGLTAFIIGFTSFERIRACMQAIRAVHPDMTFTQRLRYDAGHDQEVMDMLRKIAPYTYLQVLYHETFSSHVAGLLAFLPFVLKKEKITYDEQQELPSDIDETPGEGSEVIIGLPYGFCRLIGKRNMDKLGRIEGVSRIVPIYFLGEKESMLRELEEATRGVSCISALVDKDVVDVRAGRAALASELETIIGDFVSRARKDIVRLMNPEVTALTEENVKAIQDIESLEKIMRVLVRIQPDANSLELSEKSVYDLRIRRLYKANRADYDANEKGYLGNLMDTLVKEENRFIAVTAVDKVFDLKILAEAIKERREVSGVTGRENDPIKDVVVLRNKEIAENLQEVLQLTGAGEYLNSEDIIIVEEGKTLSPEDVLKEISDRTGRTIEPKNVVIGQRAGIIDINETDPGNLFRADNPDSLLYIRLEDGLMSQLYRMMMGIISNKDRSPAWLSEGEILRKLAINGDKYNIYIYLPKVSAIDLESEVKNYERYIREVLIKA